MPLTQIVAGAGTVLRSVLFPKVKDYFLRVQGIQIGAPGELTHLVPFITWGKGVPTITGVAGSIYFNRDATSQNNFAYYYTGSAWVAIRIPLNGASDFGSAGIKTDVVAESTAAAGVTVDGVLLKDNNVTVGTSGQVVTDTVAEKTAAAGVTVDGALLKDGSLTVGSGGQVTTDTVAERTAAAGVTVDGCLIKDGRAAALATASMFPSTEQTGTGSPQNIAHGLGTVPSMAWFAVSEDPAGTGFDIEQGTHTTTNLVVTVTAGVKFYAYALK